MTDSLSLATYAATVMPDQTAAHAAIRCIVDWAGCAIAGSGHPAVVALAAALDETIGTSDACTVVGRRDRSSPFGAALVNGAASHVLDFDDVNVAMIGHPATVVVPAALAVAEYRHRRGDEVLAAVVGGYEVAARLGALVNPRHYELGWHATASVGTVAAAAAAARALGLDAGATARALSLGLTQAGGVRAMFGSHGKSFHAGRAAASGVLAALLAERGLDVPGDVLHGPAGFLAAARGGAAPVADLAPPGFAHPAVLDTAFKGHAACGATHCLVDAVAELVREHGLAPADIAAIDARVHRLAVQAAGEPSPVTGLQAKFSLRHTAALAAFAYPLTPDLFDDAAVTDARVVALRDRVHIEVDDGFDYQQAMPAAVRLRTVDGRQFDRLVTTPRGRPANPMSDEELGTKFRSLVAAALGGPGAQRCLDAIWGLAAAPDVAAVLPSWLPPAPLGDPVGPTAAPAPGSWAG